METLGQLINITDNKKVNPSPIPLDTYERNKIQNRFNLLPPLALRAGNKGLTGIFLDTIDKVRDDEHRGQFGEVCMRNSFFAQLAKEDTERERS